MKMTSIESLEARTLFTGVTLLATGRLGGTNGWEQTLANAITAKLGGPSQVPQYVLSINANTSTGALVPTISHVSGTATPQNNNTGQILVLIDYYNISANPSYSSTYIGQTIANFLTTTPVDGVLLSQLPINTYGVSRGTGLFDQMANTLAQSGIWVSQETYLDPNPISAQGDPPSAIYDNTEFVDNYWRNDGSASQINDGHPVNGAYNLNVYWLDANSAGYSTPHLAPAGYYIGTVDQTATNSGEGPIYSNWYGNTPTMPARNATGYIYTDLVGASRPLSGVWAASGGSGARTATNQQGVQWGNVSDLTVTNGSTFSAGSSINASYIHEDRDSTDTVTFYLDSDRNPFNGAFAATLSSAVLASSSSPAQATTNLSTAGVAPGTYFLVAKITDSQGNTRYDYSPINAPITIQGVTGSGSLSGSQAVAASGYNLTSQGASDWAHWGRGAKYGNFDHKASGGSQISNVTVLGSGNEGGYSDNSRSVAWSDGTPTASNSGDHGYIWANNALGAGYSFTAPADTTTRTLYVYAGGYSSGGTLTAHLSDGSSADYAVSASGSGIYTNLYTITYKAGSAGQKLTISYVKSSNINGTSGSVDLISAALTGSPAVDSTPPTATLQGTSTVTSPGSSETFSVVYMDNVAVSSQSLTTGNLTLTGPTNQTATFVSATPSGNNATITATYSVAAPAGGWTAAANGTYTISLAANSVSDTSGNFAAATTLGSFQVAIPTSSGGGSLAGSQANAASSYNLTSLGASDWAHWGRGSTYGNFDHKASGGSQISNVTVLGSGNEGGYSDSSRSAAWSDGTPTASNSGDHGYIWANNALGAGYSFTAPADTTTRTLYVYAGGYSSGGTLTAHLSDGSSPDYVVSASGNGLYTNIYTITYTAASAGQTLTVSYVKTTNINGTSGSVDLIGAALGGTPVSGGGTLTGSQANAASSYNFTSLGTGDWTHWGRGAKYGNFDHKASGGSQISNVTVLGSGSEGGYFDTSRSVAWSDGAPTASSSGDDGYIWANNALGAGYSFTAPADTTTRTLYVYAGGYSSGGTLTAHLSDGSSPDYVASASGNGIYTNLYTITYKAGSSGQTLTISYVKTTAINGIGGSVDLIGAALA